MQIEHNHIGAALLDAQNGFGQIAGMKAMAFAMKKARVTGVGLVAVKNSNHFGVASFFSVQALCKNMIGLVTTNASPAMALHGSRLPLVGTNPLSVAIPADKQKPIVLDMATSVVARGRIRLASMNGGKIPKDWALDSNGQPTDDPQAAREGTLAPIGGPKGSGLSLIIDLLCGVLTNSSLTGEVKNLTDTSAPARTGHMFMAIDISKFSDPERFRQDIDKVILLIKSLPSRDTEPVYLPGEIECDLEYKRRLQGIPMDADVLASLGELAGQYGVSQSWKECVS
jgi:LDH2 family malate/lactate/ureidoglycolate dehydrogenase